MRKALVGLSSAWQAGSLPHTHGRGCPPCATTVPLPPRLLPVLLGSFILCLPISAARIKIETDPPLPANLLKNSGFEEGKDSPEGWPGIRDTKVFHSGTASVRLDCRGQDAMLRRRLKPPPPGLVSTGSAMAAAIMPATAASVAFPPAARISAAACTV